MEETEVPAYKGSIAKLGLDSRDDLITTVIGGVAVYEIVKSFISFALRDLIAVAIAGIIWRFVLVPAMAEYRKRYPPKYLYHWFRSRVLLAPVLHCRPDSDPQPGVLPDPPTAR